MSTQLDALLTRIPDANLRTQIAAQIADLRSQRPFGLVFEEHLPETVRLPSQRVRRGVAVEPRLPGNGGATGIVTKLRHGVATVRDKGDLETSVPVDELVVIRDFGDPIYPGLVQVGRLARGGDKPDHVVIEAENFHALETLQYTHTGKIACIYIDPPYNTGGDLIYNDTYVSKEDAYRHSKWLSFMERRLRIARSLLRETGVIVVAIDDNEHAHLKVLMDQVFGEENFLANVVWQGSGKNDARFTAGGLDYMLCYGRSKSALVDGDVRWKEHRRGLTLALAAAADAWSRSGEDPVRATALYRQWLRSMPPVETSIRTHYTHIDSTGRVYRLDNVTSPHPRRNLMFEVLHPTTGKPVRMHQNGWRFSPETMAEAIDAGRIVFGADETTTPSYKRYLDEQGDQAIRPVFEQARMPASSALKSMLGESRFDYPKDVDVLSKWIAAVTMDDPSAIVLDFFAGSGATAHAVMEMNALDGGRRQAILVTNNEVNEKTAAHLRRRGVAPGEPEWEARGIFEHVTRPRIETVVTGKRPDGSSYSAGLSENVTFLTLDYLDRDDVQRGVKFEHVAPLFWLRAGATGPVVAKSDQAWEIPVGARYGVLFDVGEWKPFVVAAQQVEGLTTAFVVTDSRAAYSQVAAALPTGVEPVQLYEDYLTNFEINTGAPR